MSFFSVRVERVCPILQYQPTCYDVAIAAEHVPDNDAPLKALCLVDVCLCLRRGDIQLYIPQCQSSEVSAVLIFQRYSGFRVLAGPRYGQRILSASYSRVSILYLSPASPRFHIFPADRLGRRKGESIRQASLILPIVVCFLVSQVRGLGRYVALISEGLSTVGTTDTESNANFFLLTWYHATI